MIEELKKRNGTSIILKELINTIKDSEDSGFRAYIPEYQRNYKWKAEGAISAVKLLEDFYHLFTDHSAKDENKSVGLVTLYIDHENKKIHILDGQQRLVTLMLIFCALGKKEDFFSIVFQRDKLLDVSQTREHCLESLEYAGDAKFEEDAAALSDKRRFQYNYDRICIKLAEFENLDQEAFSYFIKKHTCFLLHISEVKPVDEFLNLNCHKTRFSICDRMRSRLIVYASFHPEEIEKAEILRYILPEKDYKKSISYIFERLSALLYDDEIYNLVKRGKDPEITGEDHINILFKDLVSDTTDGYMGEITFHENDEIQWIVKLTFYLYRLEELKAALDNGDYTLYREIKSLKERIQQFDFFRMLDSHIKKYSPAEGKKKILGQILHTTSSLDQLLYEHSRNLLSGKDALVCNTMFNVLSDSKEQKEPGLSSVVADFYRDSHDKKKKEYVVMDPQLFEDTVQTSGKYMLYRYFKKQTMIHNTLLHFPFDRIIVDAPRLRSEDGGQEHAKTDPETDFPKQITAGDLLLQHLVIPIVQRDYCLGAHLSDNKNNLISYLIECYEKDYKNKPEKKTPTLSAITIHKTSEKLFLYDGQQRVVTIAFLMKILGWTSSVNVEFEGRENFQEFFQNFSTDSKTKKAKSYAQSAVTNIHNLIIKNLEKEDFEDFRSFLLEIKFDVVNISGTISVAEQYFMDINDGVQLRPYEIFKCMLNTKVKELYSDHVIDNDQWIHFVENTLTDLFYRWKKVAYDKEADEHEVAAMQLLEYCLRMMYNDAEIQKNKSCPTNDVWEILAKKSFGKENQIGDIDEFIHILTVDNLKLLYQKLESLKDEMQELLTEHRNTDNKYPVAAPRNETYKSEHFGNPFYNFIQYQLLDTCSGHAIINNFLNDLGSFCTTEKDLDYFGSRQFDLITWTVIENLLAEDRETKLKEIIKIWSESNICGPVIFLAPGFIGRYEKILLPIPKYFIPDADYQMYYSEKNMKCNKTNLPAFIHTIKNISSDFKSVIPYLFQYKKPYLQNNSDTNWQIYYRHFQPNYIRCDYDYTHLLKLPDGIKFVDNNGSIKIKNNGLSFGLPESFHYFKVHGKGFKKPIDEI